MNVKFKLFFLGIFCLLTLVACSSEFEKTLELAEKGDADAQLTLAEMYKEGENIEKDLKSAHKWYLKSANQGNRVAEFWLGFAYKYGIDGAKQDYKEAAKWFKKGADQGEPHSQYYLGDMYLHGIGVDKNVTAALILYKAAAGNGNEKAINALKEDKDLIAELKVAPAKKLQEKAAFQLAEHNTNVMFHTCDKFSEFKLINPTYGKITHDIDKYRRPFKLSAPIVAIITGVEFVCQDNDRGTKHKQWQYLIVAYDNEFDKFRCQAASSATTYKSDGNTPDKYQPDPSRINEMVNLCQYKAM